MLVLDGARAAPTRRLTTGDAGARAGTPARTATNATGWCPCPRKPIPLCSAACWTSPASTRPASAAEHRRRTLPELALIATGHRRVDELRNAGVLAQTEIGDLDRAARKLDNEIDAVRARAKRDADRLAAGAAPAKDLENMQHEIVSLARRQATLEDEALELMERREVADAALADHRIATSPPPGPNWRRRSSGATTRSPTSTTSCSGAAPNASALVDGMPADLIAPVRADPGPRPGRGGGAERLPM